MKTLCAACVALFAPCEYRITEPGGEMLDKLRRICEKTLNRRKSEQPLV